ncbi:N-acetylmuramoyl-L-alanine amidase [Metabacillus sediminilitoris]|uniref:N-acetylmuramoyl-L-alanine amidase n=1 Tax=Metabacillus sediminilitoris TaxID=2567941 RepID=A0A4S4C732_9BACI|nr:N-acetylmuramoyl-L-alanine amidase [Metabacillus sediminilitoris]QGQ48062.1 N-acetylmuramoyl-L-alanine amidase [Metabacillus sediminilitoris]THF81576.1 N-acetylmuramoyl-L-alanine amidase [Metabacillus sediminilitoris]
MKVMIDAGHGFDTAGKRTVDGMKEYEFNRAVANEMKKLLLGYEHVTVLFSHSDQRDVPLAERASKANNAKTDLFISIHANAHGNGKEWTSAEGIETYVYTSKPKTAYEAAKIVQAKLVASTSRVDRGVKTADFYLLKKTNMPAILCECGFMTHKVEAHLLRSLDYRQACAQAIVSGIAAYYKLKKIPEAVKKEWYRVQLGAFQERENAAKLAAELTKKGYQALIVRNQKDGQR